jgi:NAD(P)-dependent dehydrogenase (short-subunit alcohol dehydrogenase family)
VVITGGTGALGTAVVDAFVREGAICHVPVHHHRVPGDTGSAAAATAAAVPAGSGDARVPGGRVEFLPGVELTDEAAVTALYAGMPPELWASVHLAGGFAMGEITVTSLGDLRSQFDMNVVTAFLCCREAVRRFRLRPRGGGGRIVNVASRAALQQGSHRAAYSMSKAAVVSLTTSLAEELKREGILVNAVAPGIIDSAMNRAALPNADAADMVSPATIADVIVWLASPANTVASGAVIPVYGNS